MNHEGYGLMVAGKPAGLWPTTLEWARKSAVRYKDKGFREVQIVEVHSGNRVGLTEPAPLFQAEAVPA
jgi:hypothetical protein